MDNYYSNYDEKFLRTTTVYGRSSYLYLTREAANNQVVSERLDKETVNQLFDSGKLLVDTGGGVGPALLVFKNSTHTDVAVGNYERLIYNSEEFPICSVYHSSEYTG